jgi:hypothetical protein
MTSVLQDDQIKVNASNTKIWKKVWYKIPTPGTGIVLPPLSANKILLTSQNYF